MTVLVKPVFNSLCLCIVLALLAGCGQWIPVHSARVSEVYPPAMFKRDIENAPEGSVFEQIFPEPLERVFDAALQTLQEEGAEIHSADKGDRIIFATQTRVLDPPPDLLNCPNNHFANSKPEPWIYYLVIILAEDAVDSTHIKVLAKTQGRCFTGGGCYGYDPCGEYAEVHWAVGFGSAEKQLSQLVKMIGHNLGHLN